MDWGSNPLKRSLGHSTIVIYNSNLSCKGLEQVEASSNNLIKDFSQVFFVHIGKMAMSVNGVFAETSKNLLMVRLALQYDLRKSCEACRQA
jgi:hypothetical protein